MLFDYAYASVCLGYRSSIKFGRTSLER